MEGGPQSHAMRGIDEGGHGGEDEATCKTSKGDRILVVGSAACDA